MNRKTFVQESVTGAGLLAIGQFPLEALAKDRENTRVTILHTNDVHSRMEAFPLDGSKYAGQGGIPARDGYRTSEERGRACAATGCRRYLSGDALLQHV